MMKVRFYLHSSKNKKGEHVLMCAYSHASREWRFSTKVRLQKKDWNKKTQSVSFRHPQATIINTKVIPPIRNRLEMIALELQSFPDPRPPLPNLVRAKFEGERDDAGFWDYWERFMKSHVAGLAENTKTNHLRIGSILKEIEASTGPLSFDVFTLEFHSLFIRKLQKEGCNQNTIGKRVQDLKTFLKFAYKNDWHKNDKYLFFEVRRTNALHVALTKKELERLESVRLDNPGEARARDVFIFHCNTGLRFSELQSLQASEADRITFKSQKTGKIQRLNLNKKARSILSKYGGELPTIQSQPYSRHIKTICQKAGIDQEVEISKGRMPKYKACSTHTARRTCATILYRRGVDLRKIQEVLGHSSIKQTEKYLKCTAGDFLSTLDALD